MFLYICLLIVQFHISSGGIIPHDTSSFPTSVETHAPIIGFDCNQTEPEVLAISTLEIAPCPEIASFQPNTKPVYGQIIQRHNIDNIHIQTCQLIKSTSYFRCGGNWINYNVYPPSIGVLIHLSQSKCKDIHKTGYYEWGYKRTPWGDLIPNKTYHFQANEVGWTDNKGYCEGGSTLIGGISHDQVVVQASYTLSIRESWGKVDHENGMVNIENTLGCHYKDGWCSDAMSGTHTWSPNPRKCPEDKYRLIYQGILNITTSTEDPKVLLSVNSPPFLFTSEIGLNSFICGISMKMTEFPEIFFLEQMNGVYQTKLDKPDNLDIKLITYLNAKLTFTYHNLIDSVRSMYLSSIHQTCMVEREMLKNRIEIIRLNSASGGLSSLLKEGMFAKTNGEVIHLIKCIAVPVKFRNTQTCYDSLPIVYKNTDTYLLPNTHIITPYASRVECSPITPLTYKIGNQWWSYTGSFQKAVTPTVLKPKMDVLPAFSKIKSFSQGGMYSKEQVEAVQRMLTFPSLRESITTDLVDGITRFSNRPISLDITGILSEADWKTIAKRNLVEAWGYFSSVGSAVSGLIGIYFVFRLVKGALTCAVDAKDIYRVFGCSLYLLSSIWSRLAIYFINKATTRSMNTQCPSENNNDASNSNEENNIEMEEVTERPRRGYVALYPQPTAPKTREEETTM